MTIEENDARKKGVVASGFCFSPSLLVSFCELDWTDGEVILFFQFSAFFYETESVIKILKMCFDEIIPEFRYYEVNSKIIYSSR